MWNANFLAESEPLCGKLWLWKRFTHFLHLLLSMVPTLVVVTPLTDYKAAQHFEKKTINRFDNKQC